MSLKELWRFNGQRWVQAVVVIIITLSLISRNAAAVELEDLLWDLQLLSTDNGPAPGFTLANLKRTKVSLSQFQGRPVLLYFWATWWPFCTRELPSTVEQVHKEYGPKGLTILAVNIKESRTTVAKWVKENGVTTTVLLDSDGAVTDAYRVTGTPTVVLICRNGRLVGRGVGTRNWTGEKGKALIKALLSTQPK